MFVAVAAFKRDVITGSARGAMLGKPISPEDWKKLNETISQSSD
jgi:hypothetical protein